MTPCLNSLQHLRTEPFTSELTSDPSLQRLQETQVDVSSVVQGLNQTKKCNIWEYAKYIIESLYLGRINSSSC